MEDGILYHIGVVATFFVFLLLKLTHVITWPWLWVLAPLWVWLALALAAVIVFSVASWFDWFEDKYLDR